MSTHRPDILWARGHVLMEKVNVTVVWDTMETESQSGVCHNGSFQRQNAEDQLCTIRVLKGTNQKQKAEISNFRF